MHAASLGQERPDAGLDPREDVLGADGGGDRRAAVRVDGAALESAPHGEKVQIELPRLDPVAHHADDRPLDLEVETERREQRGQRLAEREPLELAAERSGHLVIDREAERRTFDQQPQHLADRHRLEKAERQAALPIERRGSVPLVDLRRRERRQLAAGRTRRGGRALRDDRPGAAGQPGDGHLLRPGAGGENERHREEISQHKLFKINVFQKSRRRECPEARTAAHFF